MKNNFILLEARQNYLRKGSNELEVASNNFFRIYSDSNYIDLTLSLFDDVASPVKINKNYDFIISKYEISIAAQSEIVKGDKKVLKSIDLGTVEIYKICYSFKSQENKVLNGGKFLIPSYDDDGNPIKIKDLIVSVKIQHTNPHGMQSSSFYNFLETNSDANVEFLTKMLVAEDEEEN